MSPAKKVMLLGIDAPIAPRLLKWAREGALPNLGALVARGVVAPHSYGYFPTITPPNWTSLATGALPGTHGLTDFNGHRPGAPLDEVFQNYDARWGQAETIWQAAARAGKKTILINYPSSWMTEVDGWQLGGFGNHLNQWHYGVPWADRNQGNVTLDVLITNEAYPFATEVTLRKAEGWQGVEHSPRALEAEATLQHRRSLHQVAPIKWQILIDASDGKGYDTALVAKDKSKAGVYARLKVGEWSENIYDAFQTDAGPIKAVFKLKLLELSPDGAAFRLYTPGLCAVEGWANPPELAEEIKSDDGLPLGRAPWEAWLMEWIDLKTMVEGADLHNVFVADAATQLLESKPWDLYYMHVHTPDIMYHTFSMELDPATGKNPELRQDLEWAELALYQSVDRALGRIVAAAGEDTVIAVVSDHGAKARNVGFHLNDVLEAAGLLVYQPAEPGQPKKVNWSQTKAVGQRTVYVYVNTKGRDPEGIVEPGAEYEAVQEQVIKALHEYTDPRTGLKPVVLALKKDDARIIGLYGDRMGDVVYALDPRYEDEHGPHLPTARFGIGDMRTLFILAGPGVKEGVEIERMVRPADLVPTLCHLAELPMPKQADGAVIYQALADPDDQVKDLESLRKTVERLKKIAGHDPMC
ncbi:MAG: alkaline phosphatase family protein [Chloroflexi bacterium]|nr:alkaline phosphatase family protein [Chloroflexota bacterium]